MPYKDKRIQNDYVNKWKQGERISRKEEVLSRDTAYRNRAKDFMNSFKSAPCTDCMQVFPPCVMDFDHISDNKEWNVGKMANSKYSFERIKAEIAKCELVCSNCHRIRTYKRAHSEMNIT